MRNPLLYLPHRLRGPVAFALGLSCSSPAFGRDCGQQTDTRLNPIEWTGDINVPMNSYSTPGLLTASYIVIEGPAEARNIGAYNIRTGEQSGAHFEIACPEQVDRVISAFDNANACSRTDFLTRSLEGRVVRTQTELNEFESAVSDGALTSDELSNLKDGVYAGWYVADNKGASLPMILEVKYEGRELVPAEGTNIKHEERISVPNYGYSEEQKDNGCGWKAALAALAGLVIGGLIVKANCDNHEESGLQGGQDDHNGVH